MLTFLHLRVQITRWRHHMIIAVLALYFGIYNSASIPRVVLRWGIGVKVVNPRDWSALLDITIDKIRFGTMVLVRCG